MKKYFFSLIVTAAFLTACQNNNTDQANTDKVPIDTNIVPSTAQYCYAYTNNKDNATLTLMNSGEIITGELNYQLFEKDKNTGIIKGEMRGDTLIADYTFKAEGTESVRQVIFLKKGNQLLEGTGDIEDKGGKTVFKNVAKLRFGQSIVFNKIDCH